VFCESHPDDVTRFARAGDRRVELHEERIMHIDDPHL